MNNFTEEIKNEITSQNDISTESLKAMLSAFIRTSGSLLSRGGLYGFEIVTENERTAEFFTAVLEERFDLPLTVSEAKFDILTGRDKLAFECVNEKSDELLKRLKIIGEDGDGKYISFNIDELYFSDGDLTSAYMQGAFLGGGSCTLPDDEVYSRTGYHFEIVFSNKFTANDFCELLCGFHVIAKLVSRKEFAVVYVKSREVISDVLDAMGCVKSLEKLNRIVELKETQNNLNRVNNCSVSNIDKTMIASVKQVQAIEVIRETIGLQSLDKQLFDVAECRLADKNASLQELAERLNISKSCINHRMRRIFELARSLGQD